MNEEMEAVVEYFKDALRPMAKSFKELEARIAVLEQALEQQKFCGVYQRALEYKKGNFVTFNSSLWVALKDAPGAPDVDHAGWQLCAKGAVR